MKFVPHKNVAHRLACLSLYRALLRQCDRLPFPAATSSKPNQTKPSSTLRSLVRYRYKNDRKIRIWPNIRDALEFGRGALQLLEAATTGSTTALKNLSAVLAASTQVATRNMEVLTDIRAEHSGQQLAKKHAKRKAREILLADKSQYRRQPATVAVLDRPVPYEQALKKPDGRRKVPSYFVAQCIPFLRYTHRQPLSLGRYIKWQITRHEKLWHAGERGKDLIQMASMEDDWDTRLWLDYELHQRDLLAGSYALWADEAHDAWRTNQAKITRMDSQRLAYGEKLWEVFKKERALAEVENAQRKVKNRKMRLVKQVKEQKMDERQTERVAALFGDGETR